MLNAAESWYFQIVISKSTRYYVNYRNSVTAPSVSCRESLYRDPSNYVYRGQKYCSHRQEHGMVFRSDHAGASAPLQNWTNRYTFITSVLMVGMLPVME